MGVRVSMLPRGGVGRGEDMPSPAIVSNNLHA